MNGLGGKDNGLDNGKVSLSELADQLGQLAQGAQDDFQMGAIAGHTAAQVQGVSLSIANNQPEHFVVNLRRVLISIYETIRRYAASDHDHDTAMATYLDFCLASLTSSLKASQQMGLDNEVAQLLAEHGYSSTDLSGYHAYICDLYAQARREHHTIKKTGALSRRTITATYSAATFGQPRESAGKEENNPPIIADLGGPARPPEQRKTELGMGGDQRGLRDLGNQNQPVIPPLSAVDSLADLGKAFDDLVDETTTVNNPQLDAAIAREQALAMQNQDSSAPSNPNEEDPADRTDPNLDLSKLQAVVQFARQNSHQNGSGSGPKTEPSPVTTVLPAAESLPIINQPIAPAPTPLPETGVFTTAWVNDEGRKYGHNEVKRGKTSASNGSNGKGFTSIAPAPTPAATKPSENRDTDRKPLLSERVLPPSQYGPGNNFEKSAKTPTPQTPQTARNSTRGRLYAWLAAAAVTLTGLGVGGKMLYDSQTRANTANSGETASTPSASNSVATQSVEQNTAPDPVEQKVETAAKERGIFKVNTNHDAYKKYLNSIKSSSGLVAMIKDFAGQVKVDFFQDPAELAAARQRGIIALNGSEPELEQRIAVMEAFLDHALKLNIENRWVVKFFTDAKKGLQTFKKTGAWDNQGRNSGADQLFEAFQTPVKLVAPPEVIGYAPDINPDTNPALLKVKETAPTFYQVLLESGRRMQKETDPAKVVPYDEFNMIKAKTCEQILAVRSEYKDPDARSGIYYMHDAWCKNTANPYNYLNQALKKTVPIMGTPNAKVTPPPAPQQPQQPVTPIHNSIIQQNNFQTPLNAPVKTPALQPMEPVKPVESKPGFFSRAASKVKSLFGIGKENSIDKTQHQKPQPAVQQSSIPLAQLSTPPNEEPVYTKKDIPMYSWKETLVQYFWG